MTFSAKDGASTSALCQTQAFFVEWGNLSHILWSAMLSIYLFLLFHQRWTMVQLAKVQRYDWIICAVFPFFISLIPLFSLAAGLPIYGKTQLWYYFIALHIFLLIYLF